MRVTEGFLTEREARFLAVAAAATPASGTILEIGSFKGRSTVGLATIARRYGLGPVVAVDPFTSPSSTDPDLRSAKSSHDDFARTIRGAELESDVEVHRALSSELAPTWTRPIRLLWIDGDHTYEGAKLDLDLYKPFLVDGAVVAMHDVLANFEGPIRVFMDDVLASDDFGPAGIVGSIGWAQYRPRDGSAPHFREARLRLRRQAQRIFPFVSTRRRLSGLRKLRFKLSRWTVPHGGVDPVEWAHALRS